MELAKGTQQSAAMQALGSGWVELPPLQAPSLAADPEQGSGVGVGDRAERSGYRMGSLHWSR